MEDSRASKLRTVVKSLKGKDAMVGPSIKIKRVIGTQELDHLDPFMLLDYFNMEVKDGNAKELGMHPHRGFEEVTYLIDGAFQGNDTLRGKSLKEGGGVYWTTIGAGIIHGGKPLPGKQGSRNRGFQLWVNLPSHKKMCKPRYQNFPPGKIPVVIEEKTGITVRVIAGNSSGVEGPVSKVYTQPLYLDVTIPPGQTFTQPLNIGYTAFVYVMEGVASVGKVELVGNTLGILSDGDSVRVENRGGKEDTRFVLLSAKPLNEPICRGGPFVMNTEEQLMKAFFDYRTGRLLEYQKDWDKEEENSN